jgi:hypothetical protein
MACSLLGLRSRPRTKTAGWLRNKQPVPLGMPPKRRRFCLVFQKVSTRIPTR